MARKQCFFSVQLNFEGNLYSTYVVKLFLVGIKNTKNHHESQMAPRRRSSSVRVKRIDGLRPRGFFTSSIMVNRCAPANFTSLCARSSNLTKNHFEPRLTRTEKTLKLSERLKLTPNRILVKLSRS